MKKYLYAIFSFVLAVSAFAERNGKLYTDTIGRSAISANSKIELESASRPTPKSQARAEILWTRVLASERDRYLAWPTVVCRRNGELVAVFSGDRDAHICPYGKVQMIRSSDGGESWTIPENIYTSAHDDRDMGLLEFPDGMLLASFNSGSFWHGHKNVKDRKPEYANISRYIDKKYNGVIAGCRTIVSATNGVKWSSPRSIPYRATHGPTLLDDGRLIVADWKRMPKDALSLKENRKIEVCQSDDRGGSWKHLAFISLAEEGDVVSEFSEFHAVDTGGGNILLLGRYEKDYFLRKSRSSDGGKTWSPLVKTEIFGWPPHLLNLKDGKILLSMGRCNNGCGQFVLASSDRGETWDMDNEICINTSDDGDLGYPATAELPDGSLITIYYQRIKIDGKYQVCILGTKWKLK